MTGHTPSAEGEGEQAKGPSCIEPQAGRAECEDRASRRRRRRNAFRRLKLAAGGELVVRFRDEEAGEGSSQLPSEVGPFSSAEPHPETQPSDGLPAVDVEDRPEESMEAGKPHEGPSGSGSGPPLVSHGVVSLIGRRREMEDAVAMVPGLPLASSAEVHDFFAVYDGHGGPRVAEACRERLHVVLMEEVEARGGWPRSEAANVGEEERRWWSEAMVASFARVDAEVSQWGLNQQGRTEGSTAVVAVVGPRRIVVANCGDSRAVLSRAGSALPLSTDHKPDRPDELERIEAAGGRVIEWDGCRVLGVLATSRSIGDCNLKPFVSAEPELAIMERTQEDEFLVLASDGLWDVVSNEVACRVTRVCLTGRLAKRHPEMVIGRTAVEAAALLAELALARGSRDNISVIVVVLKSMGENGARSKQCN